MGWEFADRRPPTPVDVVAAPGLLVEVAGADFAGEVVSCTQREVVLRNRRGLSRTFINEPAGFWVGDDLANLIPAPPTTPGPGGGGGPGELRLTRSGSIATPGAKARVARASRIWVEGIHDAELLEAIWGDDLRHVGVVVEPIGGIDDLDALVAEFDPGPTRRLGVLVDHLVPGTKEHRIAQRVRHPDVLVRGHPFVDVWAAVDPRRVGLEAWPTIPRSIPWKEGICDAVGATEPARFWRELLGRVRTVRDLDRTLWSSVEQLIDFVTVEDVPGEYR